MKLPISARLLACCNFVGRGNRVADIGCDHGYLALHLLPTGVARSVIASDINEGPLRSAVRNAEKSVSGTRWNSFFPTAPEISPGISIPWSAPAWAKTP